MEISWQGDVVFLATLDPYRRSLSFEVDLLEPPGQKVEGKLTFRPQPERLMLEGLSYPGGSVASVQLCPLEGPEPP
ncbi:MAG: hypothetical protein KDD47_08015 [Acidobacteria bacterium]|nr:hypothetical protein [Acidobacteriota bacterium]